MPTADRQPLDLGYAMTLPPEKAVAYFEQKGHRISWNWHDTLDEAHARAFTVAKATSLDVLNDIRSAVDEAIRAGKTEKWFADTLTPILQEKGWWGKRQAEVRPGLSQEVQLGSPARLELIYRQNVQSALMAGRYQDLMEVVDSRPYWMYVAVMDSKTRPSHAAMHGKIFRYDDPIWETHWPPCDWKCRCRVRALSESALKRSDAEVESSKGLLRNKTVTAGVDLMTGEVIQTEVTGIKLTGVNGKPITFYPGAGFNFNQAKAAWQPELEKYPSDIARQYVQGMLTGPDFTRFLSGAVDGEFPIAVLDELGRTALKADSQTVYFSTQSRNAHLDKHPEITQADYAKLPDILGYGEVYQQGDMRLVFLNEDGDLYRAAVKVNQALDRNYLLTLFKTTETKADREVRSKWERIR